MLNISGDPGHITYEVHTDRGWSTRSVEAHVRWAHRSMDFKVEVSGDVWRVNGDIRDDLTGCIDVDLGWTPATNTLPMRRLGLEVGETKNTTAAWLRFPDLRFEMSTQEYSRLAENKWRYRSGSSEFLLETTSDLLVSRYGDDLWVASHHATGIH
ncbi:MAG: hypothetical protein BMS9Abin17_1139 [Acidimicrobiia bacterium]|nr:MAG: hypothetical protein BMS9Abin17_1139 [Acidimicrobiia bacterium]